MPAYWAPGASRLSLSLALMCVGVAACGGGGGGKGKSSPQSTAAGQPAPAPTQAPPAPPAPPPTTTPPTEPLPIPGRDLDNGVIRIRMNDYAPIITSMWVMGKLAVPHDNIGADFQMAARSSKGDAYNPTQGGDCRGNPSILRSMSDWNAIAPGTPVAHGVMLEVDPRNYNEPTHPGCLGAGDILPYDMRFGVTLGDGQSAPKELMVLDMSIRKEAGSSAEDIVKGLTELPVLYMDNATFRYAYYSVDSNPADGQEFQPMRVATVSGMTHDTRSWPIMTNYFISEPARAIMLCDRADAVQSPNVGSCVALYAHEGVQVQASHRVGAKYDLTSITTIIRDDVEPLITDYEFHTQRRLVAVGNANQVAASIAWAEANLAPGDWKRW